MGPLTRMGSSSLESLAKVRYSEVIDKVGLQDLKMCPLNVKLIKATFQGFNMIWYSDLSSKLLPS